MDRRRHDNLSPVQEEQQLEQLPVQGRLPPGLRGTLFRNGPNPRYPADDLHWFGGDGMLHALRITEAGVSYRNRWVRTARLQQEARAGRSLFHGLGTARPELTELAEAAARSVPADAPHGAANTSVLPHAGQLVALEEGHAPVGIDAMTLETLPGGVWPVGDGPFTAHPKRDPQTGALWFFGAGADGTFSRTIRIGALDAQGRILLQDRIEAPYRALVHDFAVTARHVVIPLFPLVLDRERAEAGLPPLAWAPGHGSVLALMRRDDPSATLRWLPVETCHAFHVMNAWEEADSLLLELMQSDAPPFFRDVAGNPTLAGTTSLWRWRIDLSRPAAPVERVRLSRRDGEFPQIDGRLSGQRHRHGFYLATAGEDAAAAICHRDDRSGTERLFRACDGDSLSEPIFVPRTPAAAEGDGWLLAMQYRSATRTSDLVVLDTHDVTAGPVASVSLPCRVPAGFHGSFLEQGA